MKSLSISSWVVVMASFLFFSFTLPPGPKTDVTSAELPPRWELLGQRTVKRTVDRDEIRVTARDGRFSKIKLRVKRSGINMHRCVIHFANGSTQEVAIRNNIRQGGETRVIDINGGKRVISKVVFWYDTKGLQDRAVVELWGRR
jgi:endonuclease YncB( thermonuclease family)